MGKYLKYGVVLLVVAAVLAACSGPAVVKANPGAGSSSQNPSSQSTGSQVTRTQSLESKLAVGTLKLEPTDLAVTAAQAQQLLPLWEQVKTLSADTNTTTAQYTAVFQQIEKVMAPEQIKAIQAMSLSQTDIQDLMTTYNIQITPGAFGQGGGNFQNLTPQQRATRIAQFQAQNGTSGTPEPRPTFQGTPRPGGFGGRGGNRLDLIFLDPLLQVLQGRSGS